MVQPFSQKQHDVGLPETPRRWVERPIGVPEAEGVFVVQQAPGLLNGEHGDAGGLGQLLELGWVHRIAGRVAGDDHRLLGALQQGGGLFDQSRVALGPSGGTVFLGQVPGQVLLGDLRFLQIDGQCQVHRAGPSGGGGAEGGGHELGDAGLVVDQPRTLGHRRGHADLVDLLKGRHTLLGHFGRPGDEDHRALGGVDGRKGGDGVGKSGPAGEDAHRRTPGDSGVAVGHVQGRPFVPGIDEPDALVFGSVHQWQDGVADDGEHHLNALQFETPDEEMGSGQFCHGPSWVAGF